MNFLDEEPEYNRCCDIVSEYHNNNETILTEWKETDESELKLDDKIIIYFSPDSQRYIYSLYPKCGQIVQIRDNILIKNANDTIENMFHENVSYYGDSKGYSYQIFKLVTRKRKYISLENNI